MVYSEKVKEHFLNPRNVKEIPDADGIGTTENFICGDTMVIYIKIGKSEKNEEIIADIGVKTFGCAAAIASASMTTVLVKDKTIEEAKAITRQEVADALDGLPSPKMHCSNLAIDALHEAIKDYENKKAKKR
ncbi:MAG: iron-sulfur cluster assembly scaffold protein [Promethearchaeota archaeon]